MPLTNDGTKLIASALLGDGSYSLLDNSNAALGVGDDSASFSVDQSQLQAEKNGTSSLRKGMTSGFPKRDPDGDGSESLLRFQSVFDTNEANFSWEEWCVANDISSGIMFNREVENLDTKTSDYKWVFEIDLNIIS